MDTIYKTQIINVAVMNQDNTSELIEVTIDGETQFFLQAAEDIMILKNSNYRLKQKEYNSLFSLVQILRNKYSSEYMKKVVLKFTEDTLYRIKNIMENNNIACY